MTEFWGVTHATFEQKATLHESRPEPTSHVEAFESALTSVRRKSVLGVELDPDELTHPVRESVWSFNPAGIEYWQKIHHAASLNHTVVGLERSAESIALFDLENVLYQAIHDSWHRSASQLLKLADNVTFRTPPETLQKLLERILDVQFKGQEKLSVAKLEQIYHAVSVTRSVDMKTEAEKQKARVAVLGSNHVCDLVKLHGVPHRYLQSKPLVRSSRIPDYRQHREFIQELKELVPKQGPTQPPRKLPAWLSWLFGNTR